MFGNVQKGPTAKFFFYFYYFLILTTTEKVFTSRPLQWNWGSSGASVSETLCRSWALCRCNLKAVGDIWRHQKDSSHKKSKLNFIIDCRICRHSKKYCDFIVVKRTLPSLLLWTVHICVVEPDSHLFGLLDPDPEIITYSKSIFLYFKDLFIVWYTFLYFFD